LALIKIDKAENLTVPRFGDSDKIDVGEWVMAIGSPVGLEQTVTAGIVSAKNRSIGVSPYDDFIQTDASTNPGSSGGPLINTRGEVIGINTATVTDAQSIGFAIPANKAKRDIEQIKASGKITYAFLGVRYVLVTEKIKEDENLPVSYGALVKKGAQGQVAVTPRSPAAKAGLMEGDIILEINGEKIPRQNIL